jgi:hypothetical protein
MSLDWRIFLNVPSAHRDTVPEAKPVARARRLRRVTILAPIDTGFAVDLCTVKRPEGRAPGGSIKMRRVPWTARISL